MTAAVQLAARLKLPVVATHPVQFLREDEFEAHEARVCIAEGEILGNPRRSYARAKHVCRCGVRLGGFDAQTRLYSRVNHQ